MSTEGYILWFTLALLFIGLGWSFDKLLNKLKEISRSLDELHEEVDEIKDRL